ncbi:DUF4253 domain-containing protein [Streptomyces sp. NPDC048643]|uniref:DUF4253 domain-containing protein n=1 Tax=Streptomyces sp. NPDC048643 TaxID=3155637 RepID=UPI00343DDE4E
MTFSVPDGLPAGRCVPADSPVMWRSDKPPHDPLEAWTHAQRRQGETGLLPVLCYPDDDRPELSALAVVAAVDLEAELEAGWHADRRRRLGWKENPPPPAQVPDDIEPFLEEWEDDPGPPFDHWPGLAPGTFPGSGVEPEEAARAALAHLVDEHPYAPAGACLALVAAEQSADIPALLGWTRGASLPFLCALLRSWEDRFGARVIAAIGATLYVSVACPPRSQEQADHIALEHLLTTADNIVDDPPTPFPDYAASLIDAPLWCFWWD